MRARLRILHVSILALGAAFGSQRAAFAAEAAGPPPAPAPDTKSPAAPHDAGTALFIVGAEYEVGGRRVGYTDLVIENLRTYDVMGAPVLALSAEVYPAARSKLPVLRDIGVVLGYAGAVGLDASLPDGTTMGTSWHRAEAALRGRLRIGDKPSAPLVMVSAGYAFASFVFKAPDSFAAQVPSVTYHSLRFGADGRVPLGPVALRAGAGYRLPLSAGALLERFRDGSAGGIDLMLGVAVPIAKGFEARAGAEYTRYFYSFFPNPGDPYIAGGALDEYVGIKIGAAYVH
ncbi:hypothetical protein [Polyangium aurulentum]|uniref:hypothetical protein n=1 Tax=Polyangium aurulentum TaxID=2567896 RepID=UPI0010AE99C8|nr:hypothetical protein [Polyangium aurulentum]UQA55526.1 hypothetical protein E8A73_029795 [Polyangium aurulentum]